MKRTWVRAKPTLLTAGLALLSGAAAGAVMAYMTGLLRGAFSSELFAQWAEILAIAGTGLAAVIVARQQLSAYRSELRDNTKARQENTKARQVENTLKYLDGIYKRVRIFEKPMSLYQAYAALQLVVMKGQPAIDRYRKLQAEYVSRSFSDIAQTEDKDFYYEHRAALAIVNNYFSILYDLIQNESVQKEMVLDKVGPWGFFSYSWAGILDDKYLDEHSSEKFRLLAELGKSVNLPDPITGVGNVSQAPQRDSGTGFTV